MNYKNIIIEQGYPCSIFCLEIKDKLMEIKPKRMIAQIFSENEIKENYGENWDRLVPADKITLFRQLFNKKVVLLNVQFITTPQFKIEFYRPVLSAVLCYIPDLKLKVSAASGYEYYFQKNEFPEELIKTYALDQNISILEKNDRFLMKKYAFDLVTDTSIHTDLDTIIPFEIMKFDISIQDLEGQKLKRLQENMVFSEESLKEFL